MKSAFKRLTPEQQQYVALAIANCEMNGDPHTETLPDGSEAYAYPGYIGVHWGFNSKSAGGCCIARGLWPEEGTHE